jgi:hypothetical protein
MITRRGLLAATLAGGTAALGLAGCTRRDAIPPAKFDPSRREFGIADDPWHIDEWAQAVGGKPSMVMEFEAFSRRRTIETHFAEARRQGLRSFMVTWEPWVSVSASLGKAAQHKYQPEYANPAVATGKWDDYLRAFARSVAECGLVVYIRYAHEMNGDWYPWSREPRDYVAAWQRMVNIFREEGAGNAKFVYSMNPSVWLSEAEFERPVRDYWPGDNYVDFLGSTVINFGGQKSYEVAEFATRLDLMRSYFGKNMLITELNTAADGRVKWMTDLRTWLAEATWVKGVVLSQGASRGQAQLGEKVGDLSWDVVSDRDTQPVIKAIINDFNRG